MAVSVGSISTRFEVYMSIVHPFFIYVGFVPAPYAAPCWTDSTIIAVLLFCLYLQAVLTVRLTSEFQTQPAVLRFCVFIPRT